MATPADKRLLDLLEKWLKSLELHLNYSLLDPAGYAKVQAWPEHQRPTRWIIELAQQKAHTLYRHVQERIEQGDAQFSESLELMTFLANLVGSEHIERFIPLAHLESDPAGAWKPDSGATREMPAPHFAARAPQPTGTATVARAERKPVEPAAASNALEQDRAERPGSQLTSAEMYEQVIADAARLVQWGRKWYELAELISSMANRPSLIDVRRILKDNKTVIETRAGRG